MPVINALINLWLPKEGGKFFDKVTICFQS